MKIVKKYLWSIIYLLLLSCIPLLWYKPGTIGLGHDMGWSFVPIEIVKSRLFTWYTAGFGGDISLDVGTISFYSLEALLAVFHLSTFLIQRLTFMFWFLAMASSAFYFSVTFYKGKYAQTIGVLMATFYVLNHYSLQSWTIAEISKYSAMTLFPVLVANIWEVIDGKYKLYKTACITALFSIFFNGGGGSGLPLYGGLLIALATLFFYKLVVEKQSFFRLFKIFTIFGIAIILANLYWIVPLYDVVHTQYSPFAASGGPDATVSWTNVVSKNASFINLFRLQGFSSWYDTIIHPYAYSFLDNPVLILMSILTPMVVFSSLLFAKTFDEKRKILFLFLILLVSIIFTAGTHPPFGFFYAFLMTHIYGFAIFRTAFYKFGYALWFSYAFLFGFGLVRMFAVFKKTYVVYMGLILGIVFIAIYNYPFFTGSFFNFDLPFKTMIHVPTYIFDAQKYMASLPETSRIFLVPPPSPTNGQSDVYQFGYFSRTPLPFQLTTKSIITNVEINNSGQEKLTEKLYSEILKGNSAASYKLVEDLGITHFLVRHDVILNNKTYAIIPPLNFTDQMKNFSWLTRVKTFGEWDVYEVKNPKGEFQILSPNFFVGNLFDYLSYADKDISNQIFISQADIGDFPGIVGEIVKGECIDCLVDDTKQADFDIKFLPTSPFYPLVKWKENGILKKTTSTSLYVRLLGIYTKKRALELSELSIRDKLSSQAIVDQRQLTEIILSYKNELSLLTKKYSELNTADKLLVSNELLSSFNDQLSVLRGVEMNGLTSDISDLFNTLKLQLVNFLNDKTANTFQDRKEQNYSFNLSVGQSGEYTLVLHDDATRSALLDGNSAPVNKKIFLNAGNHIVDIPKKQNNLPALPTHVFLDDIHGKKEITLLHLILQRKYQVSFKVRNAPSTLFLETFIRDENGIIKAWYTSKGSNENVTFNFTTPSYVGGNYTLTIATADSISSQDIVDVQNLVVSDITDPNFFAISDTQKQQSVKNPEMIWSYNNPTSYTIRIKGASDPFVLKFAQSFSPSWDAEYENGQPVGTHFMVNDSFNGWYVDKKGNYTIKITYRYQRQYIFGIIASFIVAIIFSGYIVKSYYAKK